jgi:tRNA uridine 5-carboxymethylaminomethyl modification enzyme
LRHDNADRRLTPIGHRVGLVGGDRWERLRCKEAAIMRLTAILRSRRHDGVALEQLLRRPEVGWAELCCLSPDLAREQTDPEAARQVVLETKYAGFIERQAEQVERFRRLEARPIPPHFDYTGVPQLRAEAREKLSRVRPSNVGQAGRISGITPADLAVLLFYLGGSVMGKAVTSGGLAAGDGPVGCESELAGEGPEKDATWAT